MKPQPAKLNYFFYGGYVELNNTIKSSYGKLGRDISDCRKNLSRDFGDFLSDLGTCFKNIIDVEYDWSNFTDMIEECWSCSYSLGKLICVSVINTLVTILFSIFHIILLVPVMCFAYIGLVIVYILDTLYCWIKKIASNCSNPDCQKHFSLPVYICPSCGARHTSLRPGKYGILKRTCQCGAKLPTTFMNGREKIKAICPYCGYPVKDGGKHVDICIPVVGGKFSGKSCFIHSSLEKLERNADSYGFRFEYSPSPEDDHIENVGNMKKGILPEKTREMRLKYYQFYIGEPKEKVKNLVSICDVGGEVYTRGNTLGDQIGYRYANAFIFVIDPLSISGFRMECAKKLKPEDFIFSPDSIDEILDNLTLTLENMYNISAEDMLETYAAVVFSKGDIPGVSEKIGKKAVNEYLQSHPGKDYPEAQNSVCENFLYNYDEANFLNTLKSKFKKVQFFCCSSLGHNKNGMPFVSDEVDIPVLWILDKISSVVKIKGKLYRS